MKNVIAVIDIGKTNKKIFLFDEKFEVCAENSTQFQEVLDEDGFPCDDLESIESWILNEVEKVQDNPYYNLKAINFSTHGASLIYLDKEGKRIAPLYNYLKPLETEDYKDFYQNNGGVEEFSRRTASPSYGMLNTGLQILKLKKEKPQVWEKVHSILHYPQYLSYLFTKKITSDFTSVGAHTATWDFDNMEYHSWLKKENINLPEPTNGEIAISTTINGKKVAVGSGLHDSSSSIIPLLEENNTKDFMLLSTGTWIIAMNPFSHETLTSHQLTNNCLCFMTPKKQQIKSSMQFLGRIHEVYLKPLSEHYNVHIDRHLSLGLNEKLCQELIVENAQIFLTEGIDTEFEANEKLFKYFGSYDTAYYQLILEICKKVINGINLISDKNSELKCIYISGGFNRNRIFIKYLSLLKKNCKIKISNCKNESALGAAMLMKKYL
ncbi:carbohydrate kinase [Polaribacter vadi]|uniref:FGGY family carbohydrate kinase n=1 Tax=Polaribacter TaxID=52959 RepID=UPI001C0979B2|nr:MULTISPECIES: FGGY family carbohydrate kinase [Polaribacter]MBU3012841.1 carbohydrate kinase [Polaribacter vadi]MDO6742656.1 FGGY family carbohydrate kinase [Polaribacter sp. 1_MG-2023]